MRRAEVERRTRNAGQVAGRNQHIADRRVTVGVDSDLRVQDGPVALTREVEVGVIGKVQHGRLGRGRAVLDVQIVPVQGVAHVRG